MLSKKTYLDSGRLKVYFLKTVDTVILLIPSPLQFTVRSYLHFHVNRISFKHVSFK